MLLAEAAGRPGKRVSRAGTSARAGLRAASARSSVPPTAHATGSTSGSRPVPPPCPWRSSTPPVGREPSPAGSEESGGPAQRSRARRPLPPQEPALPARGAPGSRLRLLNARRHLAKSRDLSRSATAHLDGASSARWFDGWRRDAAGHVPGATGDTGGAQPEVARPRTWLLRVGWRRHGLVDPAKVPGAAVPA
jgi:hypothetical protein